MVGRKRVAKKEQATANVEEIAASTSDLATKALNLTKQQPKRTRKQAATENVNDEDENGQTRAKKSKPSINNVTSIEIAKTTSRPARARAGKKANVTLAVVENVPINHNTTVPVENDAVRSGESNDGQANEVTAKNTTVSGRKVAKKDVQSKGKHQKPEVTSEFQAVSSGVQLDTNAPSTSTDAASQGKAVCLFSTFLVNFLELFRSVFFFM